MKITVKRLFGWASAVVISVIVLAFLGLHSLTFFQFTFPEDQFFYAYLGFGLTSGGVVGYLVMLITISDTPLKKFIALIMLSVSVIGELLTAGFGMRVEAWRFCVLICSCVKSCQNFRNRDFPSPDGAPNIVISVGYWGGILSCNPMTGKGRAR